MRELPSGETRHAPTGRLDYFEVSLARARVVEALPEAVGQPGRLGGPGTGAVGETSDVVGFGGEGGEVDVHEGGDVGGGAFFDVEGGGRGGGGGGRHGAGLWRGLSGRRGAVRD